MAGYISEEKLNQWLDYCISKKDNNVLDFTVNFFDEGYSLVNQILKIKNLIISNKKLEDKKKCDIIIKLMEIDQNLIKGCDEYIQFLNLGYYITNR